MMYPSMPAFEATSLLFNFSELFMLFMNINFGEIYFSVQVQIPNHRIIES